MVNDSKTQSLICEYKKRYGKYILGASILVAYTIAFTYFGHFPIGLFLLALGLIGMINEYAQDRRQPVKVIIEGPNIRVIWRNRSLSFKLDELIVEEYGTHFHSNKSLKFYSGGHTFKVYESIDNFNALKSIFIEPTPSWWDKELFPWKNSNGT